MRSVRRRLLLGGRWHSEGAELGVELRVVEASARGGPEFRAELEVAALGPVGQDPQDLAEVELGVEAVEASGGDDGQEVARGGGVVVAADEEPVLPADCDGAQGSLAAVVVYPLHRPRVEEP